MNKFNELYESVIEEGLFGLSKKDNRKIVEMIFDFLKKKSSEISKDFIIVDDEPDGYSRKNIVGLKLGKRVSGRVVEVYTTKDGKQIELEVLNVTYPNENTQFSSFGGATINGTKPKEMVKEFIAMYDKYAGRQ